MNAAPAYRPALGLARVRPFGLLVGANDNAPLPPRAALALARFAVFDGCDGSPARVAAADAYRAAACPLLRGGASAADAFDRLTTALLRLAVGRDARDDAQDFIEAARAVDLAAAAAE
mgnify:CR=1 FL=1